MKPDLLARSHQEVVAMRRVRSLLVAEASAKRATYIKRAQKRRDIRTSFRAPVGPGLQVPPPLAITWPAPGSSAAQQQLPAHQPAHLVSIPLIRPPLPPPEACGSAPAAWPAAAPVAIPLRQPCSGATNNSRGRAASDAVVALTAIQAPAQAASVEEEEENSRSSSAVVDAVSSRASLAGLTWEALDSSNSTVASSESFERSFDPLASLDRVLDGLLIAPTTTTTSSPSAAAAAPAASSSTSSLGGKTSKAPLPSSSSSSSNTIDLRKLAAQASANAAAAAAAAAAGTDSSAPGAAVGSGGQNQPGKRTSLAGSGRRSSSKKRSTAAAAAAPAVTVIHSEADWERELQSAAAAGQLLVVKVESGRPMLRGAADPSLRFQTHTNLPTPLNTYLPNPEFHAARGFSPLGSYQSRSRTFAGSGGGFGAGSSLSVPGMSFNGSSFSGSSSLDGSCSIDGSCSGAPEIASPLHSWFQELAGSYAAAAGDSRDVAAANGNSNSSRLRFLSLQCDSQRAKVLCRRLGVSACLAVVLFDPAVERKVLEVCGTKIEQELPSGLLYHADVDPAGARPSQLLPTVTSQAELEAVRCSSGLSVVACHVRAAPPCIKTYAALYAAAQAHGTKVPFAVLDVDCNEDCAAAGAELELARLPTYVVYRNGIELRRLSSTAERRGLLQLLDELTRQTAAAAAPAASGAATASM